MFNAKNKDPGMTSFWCLYYYRWTHFTSFSIVSVVYFEQVSVWLAAKKLMSKHLEFGFLLPGFSLEKVFQN